MPKIVLHQLPFSAPCRSIQILADVLGLDLENKLCDLMKGEQLTPEYLKMNPHHTIPTLVDEDGFVLYESRAILQYIANKYDQSNTLYPSELKKRALVDQALQFEGTGLYATMAMIIYPTIKLGTKVNPQLKSLLDDKLALLNDDLGRSKFAAGDAMTIADISILATWTSIEATNLWDTSKLANIHAWVKRMHESGRIKNWDELVVNTCKIYGQWVSEKLKSVQ